MKPKKCAIQVEGPDEFTCMHGEVTDELRLLERLK